MEHHHSFLQECCYQLYVFGKIITENNSPFFFFNKKVSISTFLEFLVTC